jgi:hypothetical protein
LKLLFESWRKYLSEDEERSNTVEQKLQMLFFNNAVQAMHLAEQVEVDEELMKLMRAAVEAAHDLIRGYLYYTEAFVAGDAKYEKDGGWIIKGDGFEQRSYHSKEEKNAFRSALEAVGKYGENKDSKVGNRVALIFTELYNGTVWPEKTKDDPKEAQIYKDAVGWAGTPKQ